MWIRLTRVDGGVIVINFDRFDSLETNEDGSTRISSTISAADEDVVHVDVKESITNIHARLAHGIAGDQP